MRTFDAHHHVGSLSDPSFDPPTEEKAEHHIEMMDRYGVDAGLVMPAPTYPNPNGLADTREVNDEIATIAERHPERFPVALGTVEPWYGEAALGEIDRMLEDLDGVMWHNRWQRAFVDSRMTYDLVERAAEHDAIVGLHAHGASELTNPWRVFDVTESFPDVQFVVYDALSEIEQFREIVAHADKLELDNVVFDTAVAPRLAEQLPRFIEAVGLERIVFGTDVYTVRDTPFTTRPLEQLDDAELPEAEERAIRYENAARAFGFESE